MKGFSPWPGKISDPPLELRKAPKKNVATQCIYFFGTRNYAWIEEQNIKPYLPYKDDLLKTSKTGAFRDAVEQIEEYIKDPEKYEAENFPPTENSESVEDRFNRLRDGGDETVESDSPIKKTPSPKKVKSILAKKRNDRRGTSSLPSKRKRLSSPAPSRKRMLSTDNIITPSTSRASTHLVTSLLNRTVVQPPSAHEVDMNSDAPNIKCREISPSKLTLGFLGLGIMGSTIVKNLILTGHKVIVWNRTATKCRKFIEAGASFGRTPSDVVENADITFSCVADPQASKDIVFGNCGVLQANLESTNKGYVEMSNIDPETSKDIAEAMLTKGMRYLEVQLQGSKPQVEEGTLIVMAAGDHTLFDDCHSCFQSIAKHSFFMGDIGNACKVNLIIQGMIGVSLVGLAEGMSLAERSGVKVKDVIDIIKLTTFSSPFIIKKATEMLGNEFTPELPLAHIQKDVRLVLNLSECFDHAMPATAACSEVLKHAKHLGYSEHDASAVYVRAKL